ncbi:hypothetical protein C8R43DRAFT_880736 [Mycena crocata]|nr:hypothetical protein C8R43DRAFT_880736 [Mycena crocata]
MSHRSPAIAILDSAEATQKLLEAIIESPNGRRSLSRLARTCRAWLDPALNLLWRELDSLVPVIGLFPSHLLKKTRRPGLGLTAPPLEKDWEKILEYGGRISKITYDEISNNVSSSIFPIFEEFRPRSYLLPNLRHLTWRVTSPDNLDHASLFLASGLQELVLQLGLGGGGAKFPTLPAFLADLGSRMKLRSFSINSSVALPDTFTDLLLPQNVLEKVVLVASGALSPTVGRWVASLPHLKSLQLDLSSRSLFAVDGFFRDLHSGASTPDSDESHTDSGVYSGDELDFTEIKSVLKLTGEGKKEPIFPNLTQLQLTGQASNINGFLTHLSNHLTQLDLVIEDPPPPQDWRELSVTICKRFGGSVTSLRIGATLTSKFGDLVRSTSRVAPAPSRLSLEHLSSLPLLRAFSVELPESYVFAAADIRQLADAAPNLEEVKLCPLARFSGATPPQLTLENLAPLMRGCRRLSTLAVVVNAKGGNAELAASSQSLLWLHVGHSWVTDTLQVAILLSHFAPHLETIKWFTERNRPGFVEANARSWQKVSDILPHLQNLRLTERRAAIPQKEVMIEYVQVAAPRPSTSDKAIDATPLTTDREVDAKPRTTEGWVQAVPSTGEREVQTSPPCASVAIDATPQTAEMAIDATVERVEGISAADIMAPRKETEVTQPQAHNSRMNCGSSFANFASLSPVLSMIGFLCRIFVSYPLSIPLRVLHSFGLLGPTTRDEVGGEVVGGEVALDTLNVRP